MTNPKSDADASQRGFEIDKPVALCDEEISIKYHTEKHRRVRVVLSGADELNIRYESNGEFIADDDGLIDLTRHPSVRGSYRGVDPMGLFWSLAPCPGQRKGARFMNRDPRHRQKFHLRVEHLDATPIDSTIIERRYMSEGTKRIPIRENGIRGTLFIPPGDGPFPGLVDMFGTTGGLIEFRAALLASKGYVALALAYFNFDDLPKTLVGLKIDYIENAVTWLAEHDAVMKGGVGVVGVSKGSELALLVSSLNPTVRCVCALAAGHFMCATPSSYRGEMLDYFPINVVKGKRYLNEDGAVVFKHKELFWEMQKENPDLLPKARIKVENIKGPVFLVSGEEDASWHSTWMCEEIVKTFKEVNFPYEYEWHNYPGTGHLIEPPFNPICTHAYHRLFQLVIAYGGEAEAQARASKDHWERMLKFLDKHLRQKVVNATSRL